MMEQLKPCPFCGSKQVQIRQIKGGWSVGCTTTNCLCQWWFMRQFTDREQAIKAWNKRAKKTGKWIIKKDSFNSSTYAICSECGANNYAGNCKYCFECGAKMGGDVGD